KTERLTWHKAWTMVSTGFSISYTWTSFWSCLFSLISVPYNDQGLKCDRQDEAQKEQQKTRFRAQKNGESGEAQYTGARDPAPVSIRSYRYQKR
ncbi:hypothetical protein, partial [Escherichia coli]|uniref:hypothetical protein n=1 Tax=Escherichia coli TaxID=562 RepID=UPI0021573A9A